MAIQPPEKARRARANPSIGAAFCSPSKPQTLIDRMVGIQLISGFSSDPTTVHNAGNPTGSARGMSRAHAVQLIRIHFILRPAAVIGFALYFNQRCDAAN
jgi:hypothetical protein